MAVSVSVIIPIFNSALTIVQALESVCRQTCQSWELIVVDDGSTDNTQTVIREAFAGPLTAWGDRLQLLEQPNQGSAAARNRGVEVARGEWIAFLDADDWFVRTDKLARQLDLVVGADCVHTGWQRVDAQGKCIREVTPWEYAPHLDLVDWLRWKPIRLSGLLIRKSWLEQVGGFDESLRQSHDVDLMLRLTQAGCRSVWWRAIAVAYRQHGGNTTRQARIQAESVQTWLDRFFQQPHLPRKIQDLESEIRHSTYVWLGWILYRASEYGVMARYLRRSLGHSPHLRSAAPSHWIQSFERFAKDIGEPFDPDHLTDQKEWQELLAMGLPIPPLQQRVLQEEYGRSPISEEPDTFILYRILGNDLPPRHDAGQTLKSVKFLLENEPILPHCEKHWVLNRIIDPEQENQLIQLLERYGQNYLRIPFSDSEYMQAKFKLNDFPEPGYFYSDSLQKESEIVQGRAHEYPYSEKNCYVMNNNGARNTALLDGKKRAKWVLPWDGNCFLTEKAWASIVDGVTGAPHYKYFIVPMMRCLDNQDLLNPDLVPNAVEEPQILFRRDSTELFDETVRYGRRPKVDLLWRLGVPGKWDRWGLDPWERKTWVESEESLQFKTVGWVARLFSGVSKLEKEGKNTIRDRGQKRAQAICNFLDGLDEKIARRSFSPGKLCIYNETALAENRDRWKDGDAQIQPVIDQLLESADKSLGNPLYSVVHKTTLPPSGDRHDYWHPAPYWWPNPDTPDGLPYIYRDGERIEGTRLYEPESDRYDRTRLQRMFDETITLALAWYFSGKTAYAERGAQLVRQWFINPETRMNPHLRYSQVRMGHRNNQGSNSGLIETKDFYFLLDAIRLLEQSGYWTSQDREDLQSWLSEFRQWLEESSQGQRELRTQNNHGTYFDLQLASICAYLDDVRSLSHIFQRSQLRIMQQITPTGEQPEELRRTTTAHYCAFNLQGLLNLAQLASCIGYNLWSVKSYDGRSLEQAMKWLIPFYGKPWPFEQIDEFDGDRLLPIYWIAQRHYSHTEFFPSRAIGPLFSSKPVFFPHDGIQPYWCLGL